MAGQVGSLRVDLSASTAQFQTDMRKAATTVTGFKRSIESSAKTLQGFAGAVKGLVAFEVVKKGLEAAGKKSEENAAAYQRLQVVAQEVFAGIGEVILQLTPAIEAVSGAIIYLLDRLELGAAVVMDGWRNLIATVQSDAKTLQAIFVGFASGGVGGATTAATMASKANPLGDLQTVSSEADRVLARIAAGNSHAAVAIQQRAVAQRAASVATTQDNAGLERLRALLDPVGVALEAYSADLLLAKENGLLTEDAMRILADRFIAAAGGIEGLREHLQRLPEELEEAILAAQRASELERIAEAEAERLEELQRAREEAARSQEEIERQRAERIKKSYEDMRQGVTDALADVLTGVRDLDDVWREFIINIIRTKLLEPALNNVFDAIFGSLLKSISGSVVGSIFGSLFGGFRAAGGTVESGRAYVVGERGPELFVPQGSGRIESAATVNQTFNINATDPASFARSERQILRHQRRRLSSA